MAINVSGSLQTTAVNVPLDARSRIATLDDVASIVNPALGGIFYCVATGRHYRITKLKAQTSGPFTVADKQVDTYEQLPDKSDVDAKADAEHSHAQYALKTEIPAAVDLDPYLKKTDAATAYASKSDLAGKADAEHTHAQYALKTEIPDAVDLDPYLKKTDAATAYASKSDLAGKADAEHTHEQYALKTEIPDAVDLDPYLKKTDAATAYAQKSELATKADAEHTHAQYALKTEIPDAVDLEPYLKKTDAATAYASKSDLATKADAEHTHAQYALKTEIPGAVDLDPYLKKTDAATAYASKSDLAGKADAEHTHAQYALASAVTAAIPPQRIVFDISGLTSSALVSLVIEFDSDASFPDDSATLETYDSKTDADGRFIAWGGFELSKYPAAGIGAAYNGGCVIFIVPDSARAKGFYRYAWRSEAGESQGNLSSKHFGCLRAVTHQALFEDIF